MMSDDEISADEILGAMTDLDGEEMHAQDVVRALDVPI